MTRAHIGEHSIDGISRFLGLIFGRNAETGRDPGASGWLPKDLENFQFDVLMIKLQTGRTWM